MPPEIAAIAIIAIISGMLITIVKQGLEYKRAKLGIQEKSKEGPSLTTSELKKMMREAVSEANAELREHFDEIEERLDQLEGRKQLPEKSPGLIDLAEEKEERAPQRQDSRGRKDR